MKRPIVHRNSTETIVVYQNGKISHRVKLYNSFMDKAEIWFRKATLVGIGVIFVWGLVSISGALICKALADEFIVEVPTQDSSLPPILRRIAACEGVSQFDKNGNVTKGRINKHDIGKFQISETHWGATAKKLGYDIYTLEGNTAMAKWLLANYGSTKWYLSSKCWNQ